METRTYPSVSIAAGAEMTIPAGDTVIILGYTAGDFGAGCAIRGDGGTAYLKMPAAGISVTTAITFKDIDASGGGEIDASTAGVDEGGNDGILFPSAGGVGILFAIYEDDRED